MTIYEKQNKLAKKAPNLFRPGLNKGILLEVI